MKGEHDMKNRNEIEKKIEYWMDRVGKSKDKEEKEWIFGIIDALLWVIDDESGMKI